MQKKQKHIFIILAAILACSLLFSLLAPLFAARADTVSDLQSQLSEAQRSRQEAEAGLSSVKQENSNYTAWLKKREFKDRLRTR